MPRENANVWCALGLWGNDLKFNLPKSLPPLPAEVEQGNLEQDRESAIADIFAGLLFFCELVRVTRFQNIDESGRAGEAISLGKGIKLDTGDLEIDTAPVR